MKQGVYMTILLIHLFRFPGAGQAGFKRGYIITANNCRVEGFIKKSFRTKGMLIILEPHGKPRTYAPSEVNNFVIDSIHYLSYANDFYEEVFAGSKASLYKRITSNSGIKIYNGSEMVGFAPVTPGRVGDLYLLRHPATTLNLITPQWAGLLMLAGDIW